MLPLISWERLEAAFVVSLSEQLSSRMGVAAGTGTIKPDARWEHLSVLAFCHQKQALFSSVTSQMGWVTVLHLGRGPKQGLVGSLRGRLGQHLGAEGGLGPC